MRANHRRNHGRPPMKGFNFRFTEREMESLDLIVHHYEGHVDDFFHSRSVTRTDVIKKLLRDEAKRIEDEASKKLCEALDATANGKPKKKVKAKAVKG